MTKIIFASSNEGKLREVKSILGSQKIEICGMKEAGVLMGIEENGTTFEENALIKARAIMETSGCIALADDSGLEIDYLNKAPGIYSARYMGEDTPYQVKNAKIINLLSGVPLEKRGARFVCAIAVVYPDGTEHVTKGIVEGCIGEEAKGANGFGYDPIFYVPEFQCSSAQLFIEQKNAISHRGKALRAMKELLWKEEI